MCFKPSLMLRERTNCPSCVLPVSQFHPCFCRRPSWKNLKTWESLWRSPWWGFRCCLLVEWPWNNGNISSFYSLFSPVCFCLVNNNAMFFKYAKIFWQRNWAVSIFIHLKCAFSSFRRHQSRREGIFSQPLLQQINFYFQAIYLKVWQTMKSFCSTHLFKDLFHCPFLSFILQFFGNLCSRHGGIQNLICSLFFFFLSLYFHEYFPW